MTDPAQLHRPGGASPWERGATRFWIVLISVLAVLAALLSMVAIVVANPRDDGGTVSTESGAGSATASFPGQELDLTGDPSESFQAREPLAPATPSGTLHQITMHATEERLEIAPGTKQTMWTFDGQVPGPVLRGKVGDTFEITLVNDGSIGHSVDFHASKVAWNVEMRTIEPGEQLVYRFTAKQAGIFMYHCGTPPVLHHIGNGMYGAIIIDPPDLAPVDHELVMVQSELYSAPTNEVASLEKMLADAWDAVVFNGYPNQYQHRPIRVEPNQRIRVWVLDAGPSENSSFHVIGTIFDTTFKEGAYRLRPDAGQGGSQALDLQPAQGGFVEFTFDVPGLYPFVTHKFSSASIGAVGLFQAGEVAPPEDGAAH
jgi:nitrite reductase (NO-forming)